ncbi:MAG: hypothetical protein AMJ90_01425 [candidate division Zixibacteria bacterium SM23_73_2]|nr:MAG: hypothetical protein AMJ90_01425 [candidate division Zixibacteria bacterium SM23_73_2]
MVFYHTIINSPVGKLYALKTNSGLRLLTFSKKEFDSQLKKLEIKNEKFKKDKKHFSKLKKELKTYFSGKEVKFSERLDLSYGTEFQKKVWKQMKKIPYGQKRTYRWLAQRLGDSKGARAVGNACGANPFSIIIPCHRVIREDGNLGGYAGGVWIKKKLLKLEAQV